MSTDDTSKVPGFEGEPTRSISGVPQSIFDMMPRALVAEIGRLRIENKDLRDRLTAIRDFAAKE